MRFLATYLMYIAVVARAIGWNYETSPISPSTWLLLAVFGVVLFSQQALTRRFQQFPRLYIVIQSVLAIILLYLAPALDFLTLLFLPLSFQAVQFFPGRSGFAWIGVYILSMAGRMLFGLEWEAGLTNVLAGGGANILMGSFAHLITRTDQRQQENQHLFAELQEAYSQLKDSAAQAEDLAAVTERHRLVRELHDSLTQTLFSMNLAVQSAQLSMGDTAGQVDEHLVRLQSLARSAASEVQALTGQVLPRSPARGGLAQAVQRLAQERLEQDGLKIDVEVAGQRSLPEVVEANLYRIAQEALNNIARHAGVCQAVIRLQLDGPLASMDVVDQGCGFDPAITSSPGGYGLAGMAERASEIGWELDVTSRVGSGTRIRVVEKVT